MVKLIFRLSTTFVFFILLSGMYTNIHAQSLKETPKTATIKAVNRTIFITNAKTTTKYTVKVINPLGEIQATPIKSKIFHTNQRIEFEIDTKFWRKGNYTILLEEDKNKKIVKKKEISI